jgi:hypothetical protein
MSTRWSQWPCGLMRRFATSRWLGLLVRMPPGTLMSLLCVCVCVWRCRVLCVGLITRPEESYRVCMCVWVWSWRVEKRGGPIPRWAAAPHTKKVFTQPCQIASRMRSRFGHLLTKVKACHYFPEKKDFWVTVKSLLPLESVWLNATGVTVWR